MIRTSMQNARSLNGVSDHQQFIESPERRLVEGGRVVRLGRRKTKLWNLDDISMEGQCIGGVKRVVSKH